MNRKPSLLVVFLTVFIDLIGFGIVVPLVPIFTRHYGASGFVIGAIIASFSAMQFVFSPIWGRLSDRHGRRPILLISTAGAAVSYMVFARSTYERICEPKLTSWASPFSRAISSRRRRSSSSTSLERSMAISSALLEDCERSFWHCTTIPVGLCVIRTAESVLLTCWPPAPLAR